MRIGAARTSSRWVMERRRWWDGRLIGLDYGVVETCRLMEVARIEGKFTTIAHVVILNPISLIDAIHI